MKVDHATVDPDVSNVSCSNQPEAGTETDQTKDNTTSKPKRQRRRQTDAHTEKTGEASKTSKARNGKGPSEGLSPDEKRRRQESMEKVRKGMKGGSWRTIEAGRTAMSSEEWRNAKISSITADTLVVGVDVASERHYMRAFSDKGIELSKKAFRFANSREGFEEALNWILELMVENDKNEVVMGLEPTGHYGMNLQKWMTEHNVLVVTVNPFAVKNSKEFRDNQQQKSDMKDPAIIADLVKNGDYMIPYQPDGDYAEFRAYAHAVERAGMDLTMAKNRLHRWVSIYFTAYEKVFWQIDAESGMVLFEKGLLPGDLVSLGPEGILDIFKENRLRGCGIDRATKIYEAAKESLGLKDGLEGASDEVRMLVEDIRREKERILKMTEKMNGYCEKLYNVSEILEIRGITLNSLAPFLADLGDISRFRSPREIIKYAGINPVTPNSSGKNAGKGKISKRGRKRLRKHIFLMAFQVSRHAPEWKTLHEYYTTRPGNQLKPLQSLMALSGKLIRVIWILLKTDQKYDPEKMLTQIKRIQKNKTATSD